MKSLSVGNINGIDIKLHPTLLLVLFWVIIQWSRGDESGPEALVHGALMVAALFVLVLLHEFGHSLMAQELGVRVRDITLVPFGGIARIEQMPEQARQEAIIALAGPAVNLGLAALLVPLVVMVGIINHFDSVMDFLDYGMTGITFGALVIYLFLANLMLLVFNLLPAFPMDGGRVLRAGMSRLIGRERATSMAVWIGIFLAVILAMVGIAAGQYTLPLLSVFIIVAAWSEGRAVRIEEALRRMRVGQFAVWDGGGVDPAMPAAVALGGGLRDVAVIEDGRVVGMLWRPDLLRAINSGGSDRLARDLMDRDVVTASSDTSIYEAHRIMQLRNQWTIPVTEGGIYRGVFTADRFMHVYREIDHRSPRRRRMAAASATARDAWRDFVR